MFLSRKLEAFMAVVENGSLSKAARVMNRTTPPVAKSIKDFESIIGKKLFKREKFGMSLTRDGEVLYNDLKDLYQQEKEITKKHLTGHVSNVINIYYDWGKSENLTQLYKIAEKNNIQANIIKFYYENIDEIGDYDGNSLILSSEKIASERFMLLNEVQDIGIGEDNRKRWLRTGKCSFLPEEREWLERLQNWGLVDTFRAANPDCNDHFSWFDYRSRGFDENRGLRIDLLLASQPLAARCIATGIDYAIRGMEKPSDHAPVWSEFSL